MIYDPIQETAVVTCFGDGNNFQQIKLVEIGVIVGKISSSSIVFLFVYLSWMVSLIFQRLASDVSRAAKLSLLDKPETVESYLKEWQRNHRFACKYIKRINECFGLILLVFFIAQFICFMAHSFFVCKHLIAMIKSGDLFPSKQSMLVTIVTGLNWISPLFRIYIIAVVCDQIQSQATELLNVLRKLRFSDSVTQIQVIKIVHFLKIHFLSIQFIYIYRFFSLLIFFYFKCLYLNPFRFVCLSWNSLISLLSKCLRRQLR